MCNPFHGLNGEGLLTSIPATDHERALIIAVDQAHQIAQHNAVFVPQARARQKHGGITRVFDVHRQTGGNELPCIGLQGDGGIQTGPQIEARTARCGVCRQLIGHAGIQNFQVNIHRRESQIKAELCAWVA